MVRTIMGGYVDIMFAHESGRPALRLSSASSSNVGPCRQRI